MKKKIFLVLLAQSLENKWRLGLDEITSDVVETAQAEDTKIDEDEKEADDD